MTEVKKYLSAKNIIRVSVILFFVLCVIAPIISMFCRISTDGLAKVARDPQFVPALRNSLLTALTATVISVLLALAAAFALERTAIRFRAFFGTVFVLPMLIPSISHAFGLISLYGANGWVTNLFGTDSHIYGFAGIVMGSVMYAFPVAFLMFRATMQYEDGMPYQAAKVLGVPPVFRFLNITLPYMKRTLISAFFAVFTMIVTDYGVPLTVGGKMKTLSVLMYEYATKKFDYDAGSVIGVLLLLPAVVAFLVDLFTSDNGQNGFVSDTVAPSDHLAIRIISYVFSGVLSVVLVAPVVSFCAMIFETKYPVDPTFTFHHVERAIQRGAGEGLLHSLLYAVLAAAIGTLLAFLCAYLTARYRDRFGRALHLVCMTSMAIPGMVLGLSYLIFFRGSFVYGTVVIIALVNSVHFFASPYLMIYNTFSKVNPNLEDVGSTLGVKRIYIILHVIVPKVKYTLCEMFVYFFVNSMMTISAVSFLAPPAPKPVALMINQFEDQSLMEAAAFVSVMILAINMLLKGIMAWIRLRSEKPKRAIR